LIPFKTQFWSGCIAGCAGLENNRNLAIMLTKTITDSGKAQSSILGPAGVYGLMNNLIYYLSKRSEACSIFM